MTSEVEERPRLITAGYGRHGSQWVNRLDASLALGKGHFCDLQLKYFSSKDLKESNYLIRKVKLWITNNCYINSFKCYYDQILDTHFFSFSYTTGLSKISCQISIWVEN